MRLSCCPLQRLYGSHPQRQILYQPRPADEPVPALTRYPDLDATFGEGPAVPADPPARDGELERLRKRVGLQAQGTTVLPHGLEPLPIELETLGVRRRAGVLT